jgi:hypothetical protein
MPAGCFSSGNGLVTAVLPGPKAAAAGIKEFNDAGHVVHTEPDEAERVLERAGSRL